MKKILSTALITSLVAPLLVLAQTDGQAQIMPTSMAVPTMQTMEMPADAPTNTEAGRDTASGQATGRKMGAPRDAASGLATGKRMMAAGTSSPEALMKAKEKANRMMDNRASSTPGSKGFCSELDRALTYLDTKAVKIDTKKQTRESTVDQKRVEMRSGVDQNRAENKAKRENQFTELRSRATTETQKAAVEAFIKSMEQALSVKNAAMDAVIAKHRAEVDKITTSRRADTEKAMATLKTSVEAAKTKAKTDCAGGVANDTARNTLKTSVEGAMQTFRTTVQGIEKVKDVAQSERDARKAEVDTIEATFKKSIEQARKDLKNAFSQSSATSTTNP